MGTLGHEPAAAGEVETAGVLGGGAQFDARAARVAVAIEGCREQRAPDAPGRCAGWMAMANT